MINLVKRKNVDLLIEEFWKNGYLTVSRKFGTYLPEPSKVGNFEVDIVARQKNNYAIGITLTPDDLNDPSLAAKLNFLATRQTKYSNRKVALFIGVAPGYLKNAKSLIQLFDPDIRNNIRLFEIVDKGVIPLGRNRKKEKILFS